MVKTMEKLILGVLLVAILAVGSFIVTAVANHQKPVDFISSIRTSDAGEVPEAQESAQLAALAKISAEDAKKIALNAVDTDIVGEVTDIQIENEDGNVVYTVEFRKNSLETDVKVDAGSGKVLLIEDDKTETDNDDGNDD